jgi:hypothetical protein
MSSNTYSILEQNDNYIIFTYNFGDLKLNFSAQDLKETARSANAIYLNPMCGPAAFVRLFGFFDFNLTVPVPSLTISVPHVVISDGGFTVGYTNPQCTLSSMSGVGVGQRDTLVSGFETVVKTVVKFSDVVQFVLDVSPMLTARANIAEQR